MDVQYADLISLSLSLSLLKKKSKYSVKNSKVWKNWDTYQGYGLIQDMPQTFWNTEVFDHSRNYVGPWPQNI